MRSILLAFMIAVSTIASASGSNTVFNIQRYYVYTDVSLLEQDASVIRYLESLDRQIYVVEVNSYDYYTILEYLSAGYDVEIAFGRNEPIEFRYSPSLGLVTGETAYGSLVILSPQQKDCHDHGYPY